jgi:hypothetical protein
MKSAASSSMGGRGQIAARFGASTALSSVADALEQYWKERDSSYNSSIAKYRPIPSCNRFVRRRVV